MEPNQSAPSTWSNVQAYGMAAVCLLLGLVAGYFMRGSQPASTASTTPSPQQNAQHAPDAGNMQVTPEAMKHMADKQAEPLLAKLEKNPNDAALLAQLGKTYLSAQQLQMAAEYYERSVKIKPDAAVLTTLGGVYHYQGADDKALAAWNGVLQIEPGNPDALFNSGMVKWQVYGDPKAAIAAWTKLIQANPNHPQRKQVEELIARAKAHVDRAAASVGDKP
jgi:cytochrome c-type biogenesis protein CcmH/NrfG